MNPEFFTIEQRKEFGMWPDMDLISRGIIPYIKRMKVDTVTVTIKGDLKGENIADLLDNCEKIGKIYYSNDYADTDERVKAAFNKNTQPYTDKIAEVKGKKVNVVCIDKSACNAERLALYYENLVPGGIFCGNGHESMEVKQALSKFRRDKKIGTPIEVSNRAVWFWIKR
tara:strand:- start:1180 stop:1689 length:510 start_codon:yes stop_codon:yes gene_type:complete